MADTKVEKVEVTIKNDSNSERVFNDVVSGSVTFAPGETKTFKVSQGAKDELDELEERGVKGGWTSGTKSEAKKSAGGTVEEEEELDDAPGADKQIAQSRPRSPLVTNVNPAAETAQAKMSKAELNEMTKDELVKHASTRGVEVSQSWSKDEIVSEIAKKK
jgi:hypothetical protein